MFRTVRQRLSVVFFLVAALTAPTQAQSKPANERLAFLALNREWVIDIGDVRDDQAQVWTSARPQAFVIVSPSFKDAIVIWPAGSRVERLAKSHLIKANEEAMRVADDHQTQSAGQFKLSQTFLTFDFDGRSLKMKIREALLGYQTAEQIKAYDPLYERRAEAYTPDADLVAKIKSSGRQAEVTVLFGSWCPHCQHKVPLAIRVEEALSGSGISFRYYAVPRGPGFAQDPLVRQTDVKKVPTGIVKVGGQEVGRLIGEEFDQPEARIIAILEKK